MQVDWPMLGVTLAGVVCSTTVPICIYMFTNRRTAKREIQEKHDQNMKIWEQIEDERRFFTAHEHREASGPLCAENIKKSPYKLNGG